MDISLMQEEMKNMIALVKVIAVVVTTVHGRMCIIVLSLLNQHALQWQMGGLKDGFWQWL